MLPLRARVNLGTMALKGCSVFPALQGAHHETVQCHIQNTHSGGGSYPSAEKQSVYSTAPVCFWRVCCSHLWYQVFLSYIKNSRVFIWFQARNDPQKLGKVPRRVGNWKRNRNDPNYSIDKISQNTEKSLGEQRRLVVTHTQVKDCYVETTIQKYSKKSK